MEEMLSAQNMLRDEMKEKEFYKALSSENLQNYINLEQEYKQNEKEHKRKAADL